jgi:hypothetical protein
VSVSAIDCVQPAIRHVREQLFARFRWGQWSRLALVGILAAELHAGGCNFGRAFSRVSQSQKNGHDIPVFHPPHIDPARIAQFLGLFLFAILIVIVLGFVLLYVNSVFRFILFDSVLRRECSISEGWRRWHHTGGRFFLWQLVFQISAGLLLVFLIGVPLALAGASGWITNPMEHLGRLAGGVILLIGAVLIFALVVGSVQVLARDFLVPIMAIEGVDFADGWSRLLALIRPEPGQYVVYLLLKLVLAILAAILFGIISIIPILTIAVPVVVAVLAGKSAGLVWSVTTISMAVILGTMLLLGLIYLIALVSAPAIVFFPAFSIYFFASRYPNLNMLLNPSPVMPPPESPPLPLMPPPLPPSPEPIG